ncbi:hypothetical protein E1264_03480 [Actinomadura sp. KC216]|uniref:hypothetical protein n=1 Tax=Actinomadura sp. KC216 TaxID=2530370 RepID=UPI001043A3B7|nr:hypothetical protein [Actinomadura sp. KC216]TDB90901.1 hypothetical protein E1264_03480 [Actinomadura sp. KC216]
MSTHEISHLDTIEIVLPRETGHATVRVTGSGEILINVIDDDGNEKGFFAKIDDIVKSPEELGA